MKKLEELGISPAPWRVITVNGSLHSVEAYPYFIGDLMHIDTVCNLRKARPSDARLIAAAPKLYDALCGLLEIVCDDCKSAYKVDCKCVKCPRVKAAEAALAAAADGTAAVPPAIPGKEGGAK